MQIGLAPPQGIFRLFALRDVCRATHELHQIPSRIQNWTADGVDVFDYAARKKNSVFHFVIRLPNDCSSDCAFPLGSVFWMDALKPLFPSGHSLFRSEAINAIPFLGQMQGVSSRYLPNPTPGMREPLRFRKITLALPQRFFGPLAVLDIKGGCVPLDDFPC